MELKATLKRGGDANPLTLDGAVNGTTSVGLVSGQAITQDAGSVITTPSLTASASTGIALGGSNAVGTLASARYFEDELGLKPIFLKGPDMMKFLEEDDALNKSLMTEAGFVAQ